MTWKERRNVTILLSIAGALFLALLIVFGMIYRQGREEALAGKDAAPAGFSAAGMAAVHAGLAAMGFGPLNAYCLMVFCLLYVPCAATIGVIKKESGSWKWTAFSVCFQVAVAYGMAFLIYQIGSLLV